MAVTSGTSCCAFDGAPATCGVAQLEMYRDGRALIECRSGVGVGLVHRQPSRARGLPSRAAQKSGRVARKPDYTRISPNSLLVLLLRSPHRSISRPMTFCMV